MFLKVQRFRLNVLLLGVLLGLFVAACDGGEDAPLPTLAAASGDAGISATRTLLDNPTLAPVVSEALTTPSAIPPSPTPFIPLAARVNGEPISEAAYERELARYMQGQASLGLQATPAEAREIVLNSMIDQTLMRQAAQEANIVIPTDVVAARVAQMREDAGSPEQFQAWLASNLYTEDELMGVVGNEMLVAEIVNQVTAAVPTTIEQVHASYVQVDDAALAQELLNQLRGGTPMAQIAQQHSIDRMTGENGGDLGWFTRGTLFVPQLEEAAFALEVGAFSEVVAVSDENGSKFYVVQLIERDNSRAMEPAQRSALIGQSIQEWISGLRAAAQIERLLES